MAELLAVLAIIGIIAAAASPVFVRTMRDGRVGSAANQIAETYRVARSRALGRGSCVLVRFNDGITDPPTAVNTPGHFTIFEATIGTADDCAPLPSSSCNITWQTSSQSRFVAFFDERAPQYSPALATFYDAADPPQQQGFVDVAFTPRGRTFVRYDAADSFLPLRGVLRIEVKNTTTSFVRQVIVPPNGAARVVTRM